MQRSLTFTFCSKLAALQHNAEYGSSHWSKKLIQRQIDAFVRSSLKTQMDILFQTRILIRVLNKFSAKKHNKKWCSFYIFFPSNVKAHKLEASFWAYESSSWEHEHEMMSPSVHPWFFRIKWELRLLVCSKRKLLYFQKQTKISAERAFSFDGKKIQPVIWGLVYQRIATKSIAPFKKDLSWSEKIHSPLWFSYVFSTEKLPSGRDCLQNIEL